MESDVYHRQKLAANRSAPDDHTIIDVLTALGNHHGGCRLIPSASI